MCFVMSLKVVGVMPPPGLQGHPPDAGAGLGPEARGLGEVRRRPDGAEAAALPGRADRAAVRAPAGDQQTQHTVPHPGLSRAAWNT